MSRASATRRLILVAIAWLVVAALLLVEFQPASGKQWVWFVALGPPLYVLGEAGFGWLLSPRHGQSVSKRPFSTTRILLALPVALGLVVLGLWLWSLASPHSPG